MSLNGKTMFISGASRGIGLAIAKRAARDGANIALIAKTAEPHPKLPGTVFTAAKELEEAGGQALPIVGDIRDPDAVASAVATTVEQFGGIDICVNNASAINLGSITEVPMKRFDLMNGIQVRGTYAVSQACIPHMKGRENPHILTLSPPILLEKKWLRPTAYMMAKYGMTLCALGIAEEMRAAASRRTRCGHARWWPPRRYRTCWAATRRWRGPASPRYTPTRPTSSSTSPPPNTPARRCCVRTCSSNPASPTCRSTTASQVRRSASTCGWKTPTRRGTSRPSDSKTLILELPDERAVAIVPVPSKLSLKAAGGPRGAQSGHG